MPSVNCGTPPYIGAILAIIVLFIFLRRTGLTLIIAFVLPVSIVATFALMYFNGLTLNIMTLGGLALGAGMLVDNAIVIVENIFRNMELGKSVKESSMSGHYRSGRGNHFLNDNHHSGLPSDCLSSRGFRHFIQGPGMDCGFFTGSLAVYCNPGDSHAIPLDLC